ncbi:MAG: triose-phosphate isomerase [Bryobacterales bacterium]|nr:triose-phosphate isomerase [Bryobacterales bacterium]
MKRPLILGNQKLFLNLSDAVDLANHLNRKIKLRPLACDLVLCPSFMNLGHVAAALSSSEIKVGAQNVHQVETGPFTGQVSVRELVDLGVSHVILGHSEVRAQQGETNAQVRVKVEMCLQHGVVPVVCVGDTREEWEAGKSMDAVNRQLLEIFTPPLSVGLDAVVVAYEPLWAIKRGRDDKHTASASPEAANRMHACIRSILLRALGRSDIHILYGGSVNQTNSSDLLTQDNIDGLLVGTASVNADSFLAILEGSEAPSTKLYVS